MTEGTIVWRYTNVKTDVVHEFLLHYEFIPSIPKSMVIWVDDVQPPLGGAGVVVDMNYWPIHNKIMERYL